MITTDAFPPVAIAVEAEVALINNSWRLFRSARYQLANQTVEDISNHLQVESTILNIISFSDDYSKSTATYTMWLKDTGDGAAAPGESLLRRTNATADAEIEVYLSIMLSIRV